MLLSTSSKPSRKAPVESTTLCSLPWHVLRVCLHDKSRVTLAEHGRVTVMPCIPPTPQHGPKFACNKTAPTETQIWAGCLLTRAHQQEEIEIVNQTISTLTLARDGTEKITVSGQLRYVANGTPVQDDARLVLPHSRRRCRVCSRRWRPTRRLLDENLTDGNGAFTLQGFPSAPTAPGMHNIVIEHRQSRYVSHDGIIYDGYINLTENSTIEHTAPLAINAPIVGAGSTTVIEGRLTLQNQPTGRL